MKKLLERLVKKMAKDYLPTYRYSDNIKKSYQDRFYGYKHTLGCGDGEIYDEKNMTSDHFPVMSPRNRRLFLREDDHQKFVSVPQGINGEDGLMIIGDGNVLYNGIVISLPNEIVYEQNIVWLGQKYCLFPSQYMIDFSPLKSDIHVTVQSCDISLGDSYDELIAPASLNITIGDIMLMKFPRQYIDHDIIACCTGETGTYYLFPAGTFPNSAVGVEITFQKIAHGEYMYYNPDPITCDIKNGTYGGESAELNTIKLKSSIPTDKYKVGDAVQITGATNAGNNQTAIIREISNDQSELRFSENTFVAAETDVQLTISRNLPTMDYVCAHDNRLWGCRGDTIYASKLGDPTNFNVFDNLASDSFAADVGSGGDFTACYSYNGYPLFFKEEHIYKVYGTRPQNYQITDTMTLGVEKGSHKSLAVAGETLYYKSRAGFMAYTGGVPKNISADLGNDVFGYENAVGGSNGVKYYVSVQATSISYLMFTYDPRYGVWHKEDDTEAFQFAFYNDALYCMRADGEIFVADTHGRYYIVPFGILDVEPAVSSYVMFGDFVNNDPNKKGISKIQFRCEVENDSKMAWKISYDKDEFEDVIDSATRTADIIGPVTKRSYYRPLTPHRPDNYRLYIEGEGDWKLYSLSKDEYSGSELQKH